MSDHTHLTVRRGHVPLLQALEYNSLGSSRYHSVYEILIGLPPASGIDLELTLTVERNHVQDITEHLTAAELYRLRVKQVEAVNQALTDNMNSAILKELIT